MKSLMLESGGKPVRVQGNGFDHDGEGLTFAVENGDGTHTVVQEATIAKGDDHCWSQEHVNLAIAKAGSAGVSFRWVLPYERADYPSLSIYAPGLDRYRNSDGGWHPATWVVQEVKRQKVNRLAGNPITDDDLTRLEAFIDAIEGWHCLSESYASWESFGGKKRVSIQVILAFLGEGTVVTPESLKFGCPKGETRPRLRIGDTVEVNDESGVVVSITASGVVVQKANSKTTHAYNSVQPAKGMKDAPPVEATIKQCMKSVVARKHVLYRAKLTMKDNISVPLFPTEEERPQNLANVATCSCPICGWPMVHMPTSRWSPDMEGFTCAVCKQSGSSIAITSDEVILRMNRRPSKNQFAIREAPCCANCGNFEFETGRQGKRSTGYCRGSNQCLQAFNTCEWWFPRDPEKYRSNMRQHVTNLGYGVSDHRNTSRNDIRDTIYRKEDHEEQRARAEQATSAYTFAYTQLMDALAAEGRKLPLVEEADDALKEQYGKDLDGGV